MQVPISALYASLLGLLLVGLSLRVIMNRRRARVGLGHSKDEHLQRMIRVQANFIEYVPFALILLLVYELMGGTRWILHAVGGTLILGRMIHAWGLSHESGRSFGRTWGTLLTYAVIVMLALLNLTRFISWI